MLVTGTVVSILLILMAIFAPLVAPYSFDTYQDAAGALPDARASRPIATPGARRSRAST